MSEGSAPFTPEQEARLIELIREHCRPYDAMLDVVMALRKLTNAATVARDWKFGVTRLDRQAADDRGDPR